MPKLKPAPLRPGTVVGGYHVVRTLAASDLGHVYVVLDGDGHELALKEYLPAAIAARADGACAVQAFPKAQAAYQLGVQRFFEVGQWLAPVAHPAVVSVRNFFRENGTAYMAMDLLHGATLQDFILTARARKQPIVLREASIRSICRAVLSGLRALHGHGLMHLDVKPSNIFVTRCNRIVLIDFGAMQRRLQSGAAEADEHPHPMYTPGFAAPEMYRVKTRLGPWTDLYAVGACLYSCLSGYPPVEVPQRLKSDPLGAALAVLRGEYSEALVAATRWCLALDAAARPQSVAALQAALDG